MHLANHVPATCQRQLSSLENAGGSKSKRFGEMSFKTVIGQTLAFSQEFTACHHEFSRAPSSAHTQHCDGEDCKNCGVRPLAGNGHRLMRSIVSRGLSLLKRFSMQSRCV